MAKSEKHIDGYTLTAKMRKARRRHPLTATEQALYNELVAICNEDVWVDVFSCSNDELCAALRITENTLNIARQSLIQAGLLHYASGKSKRQFGKYSFVVKLTTSKNEVKAATKAATNTSTNPGTNPATNPEVKAEDSNKTETKTETKLNNPAGVPPGDDQKKEVTPFWKLLVEDWNLFYKKHFSRSPSFDGQAAKNFKSILKRLEKHSAEAGHEWTQEVAQGTLTEFLNKALMHSPWLKNNFLLGNIASQYDAIINLKDHGTSSGKNGKAGSGAKVTGTELNAKFNELYPQR